MGFAARLRAPVLVIPLLGAGCGPDDRATAELAQVCDEDSPVQILELDPTRTIAEVAQVDHVADRRTLRITYVDPDAEDSPFDPDASDEVEYWSVGSCGASPRRVAPDRWPGFSFQHWPDLSFDCEWETGQVAVLDASEGARQNVTFSLHDCNFVETEWGLVDVVPRDDDTGALVLLPFPEDPWTQQATAQTVLEPIRIRAVPSHTAPEDHEVLAVSEAGVFAITPEDDLVQVSVPDGAVTIVASSVREFEISLDRRWIVWQDTTRIGDDEDWPAGAIYLLERESGSVRRLADAPLAAALSSVRFMHSGIVRLQLGYLYESPERVYRVSDLAFVDLPLGLTMLVQISDGRFLVSDYFGKGPFALVDPSDFTITPLFDGPARVRVEEDHLEFLQHAKPGRYAEGPLWRVEFDGTRSLIANRATASYRFFPDGRVLTTNAVDDDGLGELVVVDPDDLVEQLVDDRVVFTYSLIESDETIVYGVMDGERTGVWLARLAPED